MNNNEIRARLLIEAAGLLEESYGKHGAALKFLETRYNNEPKNPKLHERINNRAKSQNESVEDLLNECYELLEESTSSTQNKLYEIVLSNNINKVKNALSNSNINEQDKENGFTALHYCAQNQYVSIAELLIKNGAKVNIKDVYGNTPLFKAVFFSKGNTKMIKLLLENGANPNIKNNSGISPKDLAEKMGYSNILKCFKYYTNKKTQNESAYDIDINDLELD